MKQPIIHRILTLWLVGLSVNIQLTAQERIHYTGTTLSNPNHHDGQLSPVVGVHNIQTMRANREKPAPANGNGWTYNHQPMLAYWNGRFYLHYLSDPVDEHVPPSVTFLQTSADGYTWTDPVVLFPEYDVPDGFTKPDLPYVVHNIKAVMHQRVGFYVSQSGKLIAMGNYGIALHPKDDDPNDGNGIGRVVREIKSDGTFGDIYFIYLNHDFNPEKGGQYKAAYPFYTQAKDPEFRKACEEILANPLYRMQWVEEADRNDSLIPLPNPHKAFCWYTLPDGDIACLWKHALTSVSHDGGNTWEQPVLRAKGFVNSNAKIWGQRLSDDTYATVYNPAEFRWPLAISLSADGLDYTTLNTVFGEVPPMRYGGNYKSYGPQYPRGIQEGNGTPPDDDLWVTYSVNKEDIWVAHIPVPVQTKATAQAADNFADYASLADLSDWGINSYVWAPVSLETKAGETWLTLRDKDPFAMAMVERKIPPTKELHVEFDLMAEQNRHGTLEIEFLDEHGTACARIDLTSDGIIRSKGGARYGHVTDYEPDEIYHVSVDLSVTNRTSVVNIGNKRSARMFFAPVTAIERIRFRTGTRSPYPTVDTEADRYTDLPDAGAEDPMAVYRIANVHSVSNDADGTAALLRFDNFAHYVDYFNNMEDEEEKEENENTVSAITNAQAAEWMKSNIPLFECPDQDFEELYYYRWWTLRKHIIQTPVGYAMTEFIVKRSYADRYNLISCALGHHITESRWLRNPIYLDQIVHTWYRGNNRQPMEKMMNYSSWNPYALYGRYLVDHNADYLLDLLPDLDREYQRWEHTHRLPNGLYWQSDVQDGMEESISGGRNKQYARPTINSYMYGNARALATIATMAGNTAMANQYTAKADTLRQLIETLLWNDAHQFFETRHPDSLANVREAIGYLPWYVGLPESPSKYDVAWLQLTDEDGFSAPFGLTTAERRHPAFRTHGVGRCEWDGAIWPFATAQTLTGLANYLNATDQPVVGNHVFFDQMQRYVEAQHRRGRPYIGEYLDETNGQWLMGDRKRSLYYNHSTFNDLIICGIIGLRPSADNSITVNPLIPQDQWDYFCLDNLRYHQHNLTICWDKTGMRYHLGKGLTVLVDGKPVGHADTLTKLVCPDVLE